MSINYREGIIVDSVITSSSSSSALDLAGYNNLAIQVKFGTCTGAGASSGQYTIQTSNNNSDWTTMVGNIKANTSGQDLNNTTVYKHIPDNVVANDQGFGRWIRFRMVVTGTPSLSYTTYWHATE
jgi:hypothetical protein